MLTQTNWITPDMIMDYCGPVAYSRGLAYYETGRVHLLEHEEYRMEESWHAEVQGSGYHLYEVEIAVHHMRHTVEANCSCPVVSETPCKHVAALFFEIMRSGAGKGKKELNQFLRLLDSDPSETVGKTPLQVEYTLFAHPYFNAARDELTVQMRIGLERLYVVQSAKNVLLKIANGESHSFSKKFEYDAALHRFTPEDQEIIDILIEIARMDQEAFSEWGRSSYFGNGKDLIIPSIVSYRLLPKLMAGGAQVDFDGQKAALQWVESDRLQAEFKLSSDKENYHLIMEGLDGWTILPKHGIAISRQGEVVKEERGKLETLKRLQQNRVGQASRPLTIDKDQLQPFLQHSLGKLTRIGKVLVEDKLKERITYTKLTSKLYLDADQEWLAAKAEFWYGDEKYSPFVAAPADEHRIVVRDEAREKELLDRLDACGFSYTDGRFIMTDEDEIYTFLYHHLPSMEGIAEIYTTPAIRAFARPKPYRPKMRAEVDGKTDWLEIRFDIDGLHEDEIRNVMRGVQEKKKFVRLPSGAFVSLETEEFAAFADTVDKLNPRKSEWKSGSLRRPKVQGLLLEDLPHAELGKSLRTLIHHLKEPDQTPFEPPAALAPIMRDYQRLGFQWFKTLASYGFGGILADDMGLGKTLQAISFLLSEHESGASAGKPSLVVAPSSLLFNWRNELRKFAPSLRVVILTGNKAERSELLAEAADADVVVTSYPLLRRDVDAYEAMPFHVLILDEAQAIKNEASVTAQAVGLLQARHRFALTGTPIENSLDELRSIVEAVFPGLFPNKKEFNSMSREAIARRLKPFLLRRLKQDVLTELPEKIETLDVSEMTAEQKALYIGYLSKLQEETEQALTAEGFQQSRMKILAGLTRLRQLCCHPSLFLDGYDGGSGKLEHLLELLEECRANGKRVLLFSQFTGMLKLILPEIQGRGFDSFYLDGSTPSAERVEMCDRFNAGERDLFLISLKAGGTGLNLTGADTVILYDLWWNPAVEQQAADRAHRMGQKNVVHVIRLVTQGTVEEKMYELQQRKRELVHDILDSDSTGSGAAALTEEDIRELLSI